MADVDPEPPLVLPDGWTTLVPGPPDGSERYSNDSRVSRELVGRDRRRRRETDLDTVDQRVDNMARVLNERIG
jgi:hypothetical protein